MPVMARRGLLRSLALGSIATTRPRFAAALPGAGSEIAFRAYRDGVAIGTHRLAFETRGDRLLVKVEISFEVTFAFVTLYSYRHRSRETWLDQRLVALASTTDDDGERFAVRAQARGDHLVVETASGAALTLPGATLPTSDWHERTIETGQWLDTQSGRLLHARVERLGVERIEAAGRPLSALRYRLQGDLDCELWYAEQRWAKLRFAASDGSRIDYRLEPTPGGAGDSSKRAART